jgi:hypothetical protein
MRKLWATLLGGAAAGLLDELSAFASLVPRGTPAVRIMQYQASGLIGPRSISGGSGTAALGLAVHFSLTLTMAALFVAAASKAPLLLRRPWISGPVYGVLIYFFMNFVAVPLSAAPNWKPGHGWGMVGGLLAHCFYVGLPIAFIARAWLGRELEISRS